MRKKYISQQSGLTLIEVLAALTISALVIGIVYGVFTYSVQSNNKTQSHINLRQEANLIITEMRKRHQEATANYEICYDELLANELPSKQGLLLEKVSINGTTINATKCKQEIDPSQALPVEFTLIDQQNRNQFTIDTVIEGRRNSKPLAVEIEEPDQQQSFADYLRATGIFVYVNTVELDGTKSEIVGENSTVVLRQGFPKKTSESSWSIEAKDIYIKDNLSMKNFTLGNPGDSVIVSNIYVDGDVKFDKNIKGPLINGHLQYTGKLELNENSIESVISHSNQWVETISFPSLDKLFPKLESPIKNVGKVVIASYDTDPITFNVNKNGIVFYPNGTVTVGGHSTFTGIIIANKLVVSGNSKVEFEALVEDDKLPF
ncbi:prepilin-type N-terminal cleavage/methylation domain-containing protein [Peribacillus asahii]|uniref:Prepilin-type N-terminal cleavage/methylation domain-containing protein n=1 Tax=Peribacillus asahii TaxID=228899 RepID=A0A398BF09_9BACI|nr:prepilin-type N-terminal cleavage/methylation domain-containing protein [Peribacillus asahii]RID88164.1 prepilin-type N-terminal cleavage/methylation domain-containing protein [Peribacillus asahii]